MRRLCRRGEPFSLSPMPHRVDGTTEKDDPVRSFYADMTYDEIIRAYQYWKGTVDREMLRLSRDAFQYRNRDDEWPSEALNDRLEACFGDFLTKYHSAKADPTLENVTAASGAYDLFKLNYSKVDWSFQHQKDPEGPDMPWGVRTVVNGYESRYMVKSMEAYATGELYGLVGFDQYADRAIDMKNKRPDGMTDEQAVEAANAYVPEQARVYELKEHRLTFADEVLEKAPQTMRPLKSAVCETQTTAGPRM